MQQLLGFLWFISPLFVFLAAFHFYSAFRSKATTWLLIGAGLVLAIVCLQLLIAFVAIAFPPGPGTVTSSLINAVPGATTWLQTVGSIVFSVALYVFARDSRFGSQSDNA